MNDMIPELYQNEHRNEWTQFGIDAKRQVLENADAVVAISESTKNDILKIYPWVREEKIRVIHLAQSNQESDVSFDVVGAKHDLEDLKGRYFLFVGNRADYKNFDLILSLVKSYPRFHEFKFICAGPPLDNQLKTKLESENLTQHFIFLEHVSDRELAALYANALGFIFPSKHEGFGLPILEAMANGCPVVCSQTSAFPELGGDAAFYFDPYNVDSMASALDKMLSTDRKTIVALGMKNCSRFSWDKAASELVQLYKELVLRS